MIQRFVPPSRERSRMHASQLHGTEPEASPVFVVATVGGEEEAENTGQVRQEAAEPEWTGEAEAQAIAEERPKEWPKKRRGRAHKVALWSSVAMVGVVLGLLIVGVMKFVNGPVEAKITPEPLAAKRTQASPMLEDNMLAGINFTLTYPGVFDQITHNKTDAQAVEQYMLSSKSNHRRTIAVEVRPLESGRLDSHSGYKLRHLKTDEYRETTEKIAGEPVVVMTRLDNQEQSLFWAHKDRIITVAILSSDTRDDVAVFMKTVKDSVRWTK